MTATTDVATTDPGALSDLPAVPMPALGSVTADAMARLADWVTAVTHVSRVITPLIGTPFVPLIDSKGNKRDRDVVEAEAMGKVLYGLALGWDPLTSLQQIILVPGRAPSMYAKAKVAQLQSRGFRIRVVELTVERCVMAGARPGAADESVVEVTMDDAVRGEWGKTNDNYKKNPKDMLHWRAAGRLCDQIGADALMGLATTEDVADLPPVRAEATIGPRRTVGDVLGAGDAGPAVPAPASPREPAHPAAPAPEPERVAVPPSDAAVKKMFAALKELGITDRAEQIAWMVEIVGRPVQSRADLTAREVNDIIREADLMLGARRKAEETAARQAADQQ